jgi:hypothetical protein
MGANAQRPDINTRSELARLSNQNRYGAGWQDLVAVLNNSNAAGLSPPAWKAMVNGHYGLHFSAGESAFATFHVLHDYKPATLAYPHVHFLVDIALTAADTITWKLHYTIAKGHQQGGILDDTPTTITLTYTATGDEAAGEHLIVEASDAQAIDLLETDSLVIMEVEMDAASVTGTEEIFGLMVDFHYQSTGTLTTDKTVGDGWIENV